MIQSFVHRTSVLRTCLLLLHTGVLFHGAGLDGSGGFGAVGLLGVGGGGLDGAHGLAGGGGEGETTEQEQAQAGFQ